VDLLWQSGVYQKMLLHRPGLCVYSAADRLMADGPLGPACSSNSISAPSFSVSMPAACTADMCTNTSRSSVCMNPKPFELLNHFTVPFVIVVLSCVVVIKCTVSFCGENLHRNWVFWAVLSLLSFTILFFVLFYLCNIIARVHACVNNYVHGTCRHTGLLRGI